MSPFFEEIKNAFKEGWEENKETERLAKAEAEAEKMRARQRNEAFYVEGAKFFAIKDFKTGFWGKGLVDRKIKEGDNHWIRAGGERNITFVRREKDKLVFLTRWGPGKGQFEIRLSDEEALDCLRPDSPALPSPAATNEAVNPSKGSVVEQLRDMKALLDEGIVSQEEFNRFKASLLT